MPSFPLVSKLTNAYVLLSITFSGVTRNEPATTDGETAVRAWLAGAGLFDCFRRLRKIDTWKQRCG
jgi:hypothetical protein